MNILAALKGKKVKLQTEFKVPVELIIESIEEGSHYVETGPSNAANDWYPDGYYKISYTVRFTNGASKSYNSLTEIEFVE